MTICQKRICIGIVLVERMFTSKKCAFMWLMKKHGQEWGINKGYKLYSFSSIIVLTYDLPIFGLEFINIVATANCCTYILIIPHCR
jgi:hypothetical protein